MTEESLRASRVLVANACRVLATTGLVEDTLGHISMRTSENTILIRARGPHEQGLRHTVPDDIQPITLNGDHKMPSGYSPPNEAPLHLSLYRADPAARAVVHAHPPAVVAASLAAPALRPVIGAYDIPAFRMALDGIPVYPSAALIRTVERGDDVAKRKGAAPVCVLRGHGLVSSGDSVEQAVLRAVAVNRLADMTMRILSAGAPLTDLDTADHDDLPDLGGAFNTDTLWRFHERELAERGLLLEA